MRIVSALFLTTASLIGFSHPAMSADAVEVDGAATEAYQAPRRYFWSGDWYLKVGVAGIVAPKFEGGTEYRFTPQPLISAGKRGGVVERYTSRDDDMSYAFFDKEVVQFGATGKLLFKEKAKIDGLNDTEFGAEIGGFVNYYPTDWLRFRTEVRHGIRTHNGVVADGAIDAFYDVTPTIRVSGGPRITVASKDYFKTYFGVSQEEAAASGLSQYNPSGGLKSIGLGTEINWKTTDHIDTSLFGGYSRLMGPAKDSSIVQELGSRNQFTVGATATYRFDFTLD